MFFYSIFILGNNYKFTALVLIMIYFIFFVLPLLLSWR